MSTRANIIKESTAPVIELMEDDPRALDTVLRHIYEDHRWGDSMSDELISDWKFQLEMAKTSCKYLYSNLENRAMERLKKGVHRLADVRYVHKLTSPHASTCVRVGVMAYVLHKTSYGACLSDRDIVSNEANMILRNSAILEAVAHIRTNGDHRKHFDIFDKLMQRHIHTLLKDPQHRLTIEEDQELVWSHLDRLNVVSEPALVKAAFCSRCKSVKMRMDPNQTRDPPWKFCRIGTGYECELGEWVDCVLPGPLASKAGLYWKRL